MDAFSLWELAALAAASTLVGFSKTAVSGANTVSLAVFAAVLPARESTGVLLPVLIVGDVLAVLAYRRHAHWPTLWRLFPAVVGGVVAGTVFMAWAGDAEVRTSIGAILLLMAGVTVWRRRNRRGASARADADARDMDEQPGASGDHAKGEPASGDHQGSGARTQHGAALAPGDRPASGGSTEGGRDDDGDGDGDGHGDERDGGSVARTAGGGRTAGRSGPGPRGRLRAGSYGVLSGFTTMVANAGGPVMSLYLLSAGFLKLGFLGTSAWFFLIVNLSKVPFSVGLGLIDGRSLLLDALMALFVVPGALLGRLCVGRIDQRLFEKLVIVFTVVGGLQLLLR